MPIEEVTIMAATTDATLASLGSKITIGGVLSAFGAWLVSSTGAAVIGILGVIIGLLIQWYFKSKEDKRKQAEHLMKREVHVARMAQILAGNLKATPAETVEDMVKSTTHVTEVPMEVTAAKVLESIKPS